MPVEALFAQWRVVNQQANDAEHRIFAAVLECARGTGPPPSDVDRVKATQLRHEARTLFARALREVETPAPAGRTGVFPPSPARPQAEPRETNDGVNG
ncbi:MAG TPA: hypothetical protein VMZ74_12865 [Ramlibacter sp.]|nr:hypothetical protein [Ramlibacter sp.]